MECWRFYCAVHVIASRCTACKQRADERQREGERIMEQLKRGERPTTPGGADLILGEFGSTSEPTEARKAEMRRHHFEGADLVRVLPIAQSVPWNGQKLTLRALELYTDGSLLSFMLVSVPAQPMFALPSDDSLRDWHTRQPRFRVEDDLGTDYRVGFSGGGGGPVLRYESTITPAVPEAAESLRIFVRLPLDSGPNATTGPETRFDIALRP
jgi:hypothetical protein